MVKINEEGLDDFVFYSSFYNFINRYRDNKELCLEMFFALVDYGVAGILPDDNMSSATLGLMDIAMPNIDAKKRKYKGCHRGGKNHIGNQYSQGDKKRNTSGKADKSTVEVTPNDVYSSSDHISDIVDSIDIKEDDNEKIKNSKKAISQLRSTFYPSGSKCEKQEEISQLRSTFYPSGSTITKTNTNTITKTNTKTTTITSEQIGIIKQMINDSFKTIGGYRGDDNDIQFINSVINDNLFIEFCERKNKTVFDSIKLLIDISGTKARDGKFYPIQTFKHLYEKLNIYISRAD